MLILEEVTVVRSIDVSSFPALIPGLSLPDPEAIPERTAKGFTELATGFITELDRLLPDHEEGELAFDAPEEPTESVRELDAAKLTLTSWRGACVISGYDRYSQSLTVEAPLERENIEEGALQVVKFGTKHQGLSRVPGAKVEAGEKPFTSLGISLAGGVKPAEAFALESPRTRFMKSVFKAEQLVRPDESPVADDAETRHNLRTFATGIEILNMLAPSMLEVVTQEGPAKAPAHHEHPTPAV